MEKVIVNENCIGCGTCTCIASEVFTFGDEGFAVTNDNNIIDNMDSDLKEKVIDAKEGCPTSAIEFIEEKEAA